MYREFARLIGEKRRRQMLLLVPAMLLGSLLETAGLGLLMSVCALAVSEHWFRESPAARRLCAALGIRTQTGLLFAVLPALAALYVFKLLYLSWQSYITAKFVRTARGEVSARLFQRIIGAPYPFFLRHGSTEMQNLLGRDVDQLGSGLNAWMQLLTEGLTTLGMVLFLLWVDPGMTVLAAAGIAALLALSRLVLDGRLQTSAQRQRVAGHVRWQWLRQAVEGIKTVRTGGYGEFFCARFAQAETVYARAEYLRQFWAALPALCTETAVVLCVLLYLFLLLLRGETLARHLPALSALALAAVRILPAGRRINNSLTQLRCSRPSVQAICRAMEETAPGDGGALVHTAAGGDIFLRGVGYTYAAGAGPVLRDVTMEVPAGAAVGIVGASGAGKTTLLDILLGLLSPQRGTVTTGPAGEGRRVAYVPQAPFVMDDTVRANIAVGEPPAAVDDRLVWRALEKAALAETVRALPQGLDTRIGAGSVGFSGGECQRLGLARALYREPRLLVLDEATSALDAPTEAAVLRALRQPAGRRTLLLVSHRPAAIAICDRVYRVEDGTVKREK